MTSRRVVILAVVAAMVAVHPLAAQVIVEDDNAAAVVDVVNIFDSRMDDGKSTTAAMVMSLAVPGAGHHYLDRSKSAYVYLSIDVASLFGAIAFYGLASQREIAARSYAAAAAGIERAPSGDAYWNRVGAFMDAAEYNEAVMLSRGSEDDLYTDPENWWRWADESQQEEYNDLRQKAKTLRVASSFFLGAMAVNRIVSAVELRVFRKRAMSSGLRFESAFTPDLSGAAVVMKKDF